MLNVEACRTRTSAFREALRQQSIGMAILSNYRNVYYLSGHLREVDLPQLLVVAPDGESVLITDIRPDNSAANQVVTYESYSLNWPISFPGISGKAAHALKAVLQGRIAVSRIGVEPDRLTAVFAAVINSFAPDAELVDIGPILTRMRRKKDRDEIELIAHCVRSIEAGYAVARQAIHPGATELDVFKQMHGEVVRCAGYNLKFEADFACGVRAIGGGGTPIRREVLPGDLYIIDIYPSYYGYHADLCRTFAASRPVELQMKAWEIAREALRMAEQMIRPGVQAREVWARLREYIDSFEFVRGSFNHHAGHGVGLDAQEPPWIIPGSDHVFEAGDVIALEPGCYSTALQGGVRLERNYVVREHGLDYLSEFPLEL